MLIHIEGPKYVATYLPYREQGAVTNIDANRKIHKKFVAFSGWINERHLTVLRGDIPKCKTAREFIHQARKKAKCIICGEPESKTLIYHHPNPGDKLATISGMVGRYYFWEILDEMKKCVVLCRNCHARIHY